MMAYFVEFLPMFVILKMMESWRMQLHSIKNDKFSKECILKQCFFANALFCESLVSSERHSQCFNVKIWRFLKKT